MFWLTFLVSVAGKQVSEHLIGSRLAFLLSFKCAIPPACFIQIIWKGQCAEVLHEKGTGSAWQTDDVGFVAAAENSAFFVDLLPGNQGDIQSLCNRGSCERGTFHQAR